MHVEFRLPTGAGGQAAYYSCSTLNQALARWQDLYGFAYTTEVTYYKLTVRFTDERAYTVFALAFSVPHLRWELVED